MKRRKYNNIYEKKSMVTKKTKEKNITQKNSQVFFLNYVYSYFYLSFQKVKIMMGL